MEQVNLLVAFNSPFRIGSGAAAEGVDIGLDPEVPFPASSLKGRMREAARVLLDLDWPPVGLTASGEEDGSDGTESGDAKDTDRDTRLIRAVFGDEWHESPWHWDDVAVRMHVVPRVRIRLDDDRVVKPGAFKVAEEAVADHGTVRIWQQGTVDPGEMPFHLALLRTCARLVEAVGSEKSRGLGWVTIDIEGGFDPADVRLVRRVQDEGKV